MALPVVVNKSMDMCEGDTYRVTADSWHLRRHKGVSRPQSFTYHHIKKVREIKKGTFPFEEDFMFSNIERKAKAFAFFPIL